LVLESNRPENPSSRECVHDLTHCFYIFQSTVFVLRWV
jgi:hypothetical protein